MRRAQQILSANPLGRVHDDMRLARLTQARRSWAVVRELEGSDKAARNWAVLYLGSRASELSQPFTRTLDAVFGDGSVRGRVAPSGMQSDAWLPSRIAAGANLFAWAGCALGAAVGKVTGVRSAPYRGALVGALVGGALAWCINQGLALTNLLLKLYFLGGATIMASILIPLEGSEVAQAVYRSDLLAFAPCAVRDTVGDLWGRVTTWWNA